MQKSWVRKSVIIGVIFLLIGIGISPIACSMKYTIEKNDEIVENFDTATTPFGRYVHNFLVYFMDDESVNFQRYISF